MPQELDITYNTQHVVRGTEADCVGVLRLEYHGENYVGA